MKKINIFIDMDGVLAQYHKDTAKHMYTKGFFANRPPHEYMVELVRALITNTDYNVYILSSVINSLYAIPEKEVWLKQYIPEIKKENMFFVPYGVPKSTFIQNNLNVKGFVNILLDDYSENLNKWNFPGAIPIKVLNGINNKSGAWTDSQGLSIHAYTEAKVNFEFLINLVEKERIKL